MAIEAWAFAGVGDSARATVIAQREAQLDQIKREAADQMQAMAQRHKAERDAVRRTDTI